jgi:hypothetical protein
LTEKKTESRWDVRRIQGEETSVTARSTHAKQAESGPYPGDEPTLDKPSLFQPMVGDWSYFHSSPDRLSAYAGDLTMSRIKSVIGLVSRAMALVVVVVGLAVGPEAVMVRVEKALSASEKVLSDRLANRKLHAIARQLDAERQNVERIVGLRDGLGGRLLVLEANREQVAARLAEGGPPHRAESERELARLDDAIAQLSAVIARADQLLESARSDLHERESELIALRAVADARHVDRALAGFVGDPSPSYVRVTRARDLRSTTLPDGAERGERPGSSCVP